MAQWGEYKLTIEDTSIVRNLIKAYKKEHYDFPLTVNEISNFRDPHYPEELTEQFKAKNIPYSIWITEDIGFEDCPNIVTIANYSHSTEKTRIYTVTKKSEGFVKKSYDGPFWDIANLRHLRQDYYSSWIEAETICLLLKEKINIDFYVRGKNRY